MNSGKKALKGETKPVKQININETQSQTSSTAKIFIAIAAVLAVIMVVYIVWENHHTKYLVSINGEKATIEDMMYDVYEVEDFYNYMANFYSQLGYGNYWTMEIGENGETAQEMAKEECMNSYVSGEILYQEAIAKGYEITEEDKADAQDALDGIVKAYTPEAEEGEEAEELTEVLGFTLEELRVILEEREVAARYREDIKVGYGVAEADVAADIDKAEFRQYDIEYFAITLDGETEADGGIVEVSGAEKEARYEQIKAVFEEAADKDWSKVISTEETDEESEEVKVEYGTDGFIESESYFLDETTEMVVNMKNGEVSDIIEDDGYYYVIKMVNNNSTERYETEIEDAVNAEKETRFKEDYEAMKANYEVEIFEGDWKKVQLGSITL